MSCYPSSTQRRHWTLSADEIARRRSEARARAIDAANEARAARVGGAPSGEAPTIDPPTPDEEALLRRYYEVKIQKVCQAFSLPTKVRATAVALFKRFLTRTSPLDRSHSLKVTMLTSIYVACKVEENYVSAEEIGKGMQEDHNKVLAAELSILAGLEFQLVTYSPYRAVDALAREMIDPKPSDGLTPRARAVCDAIMLTDAPLTFPPGVLALAALRAAAAESDTDAAAVNALLDRLGSGDLYDKMYDKREGTSRGVDLAAELDEVATWVPAGRPILVGYYATGHSHLGSPTATYVRQLPQLALLHPRVVGVMTFTFLAPCGPRAAESSCEGDGGYETWLLELCKKGCAIADAYGEVAAMVADARALVPEVVVQADDPAATAKLLEQLADWCGRYTPWTAVDGPDGVWLDTAGCAHLFGGEGAMVADLLTRIAGFGFAVQASLAPTPGAAWALARFAGATAVVDEKDFRKQMGGLPVAALRLGTETVASLNRLGLRRVGDLYALPRASFVARYGEEAGLRLDQALGRIAEPISPRRHVAPFRSRLAFAEPIGHAEDIARGLDRLLTDLSQQLSRAARGGRRLELALFRVDGSVQQIEIGTARATRDPQHLARLFAERLTTLDAGFGVETMALHAVKASYFSGLAVPPQLGGCFGRLNFCRPGAESN